MTSAVRSAPHSPQARCWRALRPRLPCCSLPAYSPAASAFRSLPTHRARIFRRPHDRDPAAMRCSRDSCPAPPAARRRSHAASLPQPAGPSSSRRQRCGDGSRSASDAHRRAGSNAPAATAAARRQSHSRVPAGHTSASAASSSARPPLRSSAAVRLRQSSSMNGTFT